MALLRMTCLCVVALTITQVATAASNKVKEQDEQPALPLTGYDALEAQGQNGLSLPSLAGLGEPRMMEQLDLNLNPGIPMPSMAQQTSDVGAFPLAEPEYAGVSLAQVGQHMQPVTANAIGGGAAAVTATNERFSEMQGGDEKSSMQANLETALEEIKHDIVVKSKQVMEEKAWVSQVREIMQQYELKVQRVETNIGTLREEVKALYKKKRQIENLMLQEKLDAKLNDAKADLKTLDNALMHVKSKEKSFEKNKQDVASTVSVIKTQLNKLRGLAPDAVDPDEEEPAPE